MWQGLHRFLPRGQFSQRVAWLTGGTFVGQLILIGTMPLLTRLYSPEVFGLFAVVAALNGMFGIVMAGRYEFAIPLVRKEEEAAALVVLGAIVVLLLTLVSGALLWIFGQSLADQTGLPALTSLLWLVPPILFVTGLGQLFEYWSIRRQTIRVNGASRVAQFGGQAASQVILGVTGSGVLGLTVGYGLGFVARLGLFLYKLPATDRASMAAVTRPQIREVVRTHWDYPTYSAASSLLRSGTQFLPTIFLATLFGPAIAGSFDLAQRILTMPVRLLANAASQVFMAEAAQRSASDVLKLFARAVPKFLWLGLAGMAPILIAGPWIFALAFGEPWRDAGSFAQALVAYQLTRFVAVPVSQSFNILGRQDLDFQTAVLNGIALAASFGAITMFDIQPLAAVWTYSAASAVSQLAMLWLAWHTTKRAAVAAHESSLSRDK